MSVALVTGDKNFAAITNATDGDGSDIGAFESQAGFDTDADGLSDAWELACFGGLSACATDDPDCDGQSNRSENIAETDPTDPASVFHCQIENVAGQPKQRKLIVRPWASGRIYTPQFTTNLAGTTFAPLTAIGGLTISDTEIAIRDLNATEGQKFYRIQISLP
jgi:hypothetical protein